MNAIKEILKTNTPILLIAPPAWGKTSLLLEIFGEKSQLCVFIAPLRPLVNEFCLRAKDFMATKLICSVKDAQSFDVFDYELIGITPELFFHIDWAKTQKELYFILDEFHLFYFWGKDFRPILLDVYEQVVSMSGKLLFLSATMSIENLERWQREMQLNYPEAICLDLGNQRFKYHPRKIFYYPRLSHKLFYLRLRLALWCKGRVLLFVAYRKQVSFWVSYFNELGYEAIGCVGGEVGAFQEGLRFKNPKIIVATTVLSHGVNLPDISRVFIAYPVEKKDFWIQMATRGGRRGESFEIHSFYPAKRKVNLWRSFADCLLGRCGIDWDL